MKFADIGAPPVDAYQNVAEFGALWSHVAARPHARVLEVGSLFGGTLWYWSHLPELRTLIAVDLASDYPKVAAGVRAARRGWAGWMPDGVTLRDHQADSQAPATFQAVIDDLAGDSLDVLFIDGDHRYEGVRADFILYSPLLRSGGTVAFHDTWPNGSRHEPGVVRWVDELRHQLPSVEWTDPDGVGICVFTMP